MTNDLPVLYSFRRCPYAIRARMSLIYANIKCELREVSLRNKPPRMIAISTKATVPVLLLPDGRVIDESYDIIKWATGQNDPDDWRAFNRQGDELVKENDGPFKQALDNYKYASPSPEKLSNLPNDRGQNFLEKLDQMLQNSAFLMGNRLTIADIAIFPFIRQYANVDKDRFSELPCPHLQRWLRHLLESDIFTAAMKKYPIWRCGDKPLYFPAPHQGLHSPLGAP